MKTFIISLIFILCVFQNFSAQEIPVSEEITEATASLSVSKDSLNTILLIHCNKKLDYIELSDKTGKVVMREKPYNNQISISSLKPGFYMLDAYCNGINIKKGIIKKLPDSFISGL